MSYLSRKERSLTDAFDAVHDNVQFLAWPELSYQDVTVHWSNAAVSKHICLIPNGNPVNVLGIDYWTQHRRKTSHNGAAGISFGGKVVTECVHKALTEARIQTWRPLESDIQQVSRA